MTLNGEQRNPERCEYNSQTIMLENSLAVLGVSWGLNQKRSGTELKPDGSWDQTAQNMMKNLSVSGHPILRASSAFDRGELISKGGGKKSIHFNGSDENVELLLRTVISVNQLSVTELCNELSEDFNVVEKPKASDHLDTMAIPTVPSTSEAQTNEQQRET